MSVIFSSCVIWLRIESTRFSTSVFDGVACATQNCATKRRTIPTANLRLLIVVGSISSKLMRTLRMLPARTRYARKNSIWPFGAIFRLNDKWWICRKPHPTARRRWNLRSHNPNHQFTSRLMCCALPLSRCICSTGDLSFVLGAAARCGIAPSRGLVFSAAEVLDEIFGSSQREGENADRGRFVGAIQEDAGIADV